MRVARRRTCPACDAETMRHTPPAGMKLLGQLLHAWVHWRRCRRCRRMVLTLAPDKVQPARAQGVGLPALGKQCPSCRAGTQRSRTPTTLRSRKWLFLGLSSFRACRDCGWSGFAVHPPRILPR